MTENSIIREITSKAIELQKTIVLPEADDDRAIKAAGIITEKKYAKVVLLGDPEKIGAQAGKLGVCLEGVEIVNHLTDKNRPQLIANLVERRKTKGMTAEEADELLKHPVYYGAMMVGADMVDGMVAGSICPTADTVRSSLFAIGCKQGVKTVSACSIMLTKFPDVGKDGALIFADTGVLPEPNVEQLADIALSAADACRSLLGIKPKVAMLSFSTKGSAHSPMVQFVIDATNLAKQKRPDEMIDGELQLDAAIIPSIGEKKAPGSQVAGHANTLVFPNLTCGNIAYKLVERLGGAMALGPLLMGLAKPVNDLSRGCSVDDIVLIAAITAVQSE